MSLNLCVCVCVYVCESIYTYHNDPYIHKEIGVVQHWDTDICYDTFVATLTCLCPNLSWKFCTLRIDEAQGVVCL